MRNDGMGCSFTFCWELLYHCYVPNLRTQTYFQVSLLSTRKVTSAKCHLDYDHFTSVNICFMPGLAQVYYFGGARSKGFATLRNVSKLQFFDKIGQAKSVGFRLYSAI